MKKQAFFFMLLAGFLLLQACNTDFKSSNQTADSGQVNSESAVVDEEVSNFLIMASSGGLMEVQLGEMAKQNSKSEGVKNFGIMMVKDHNSANSELRDLASRKHVTVPDMMKEEHQKHVNELTPLRGPEFDEKYMKLMTDDHKEDIELFQKASTFDEPEVKAFAEKTLPILKKHLEAAKKIEKNLMM